MRPVAVDLFSGAGGMSLGFEAAGFDVAAAVDCDPVHLATYGYNFPFTALMAESVADLSASTIRNGVAEGLAQHRQRGQWDGIVDCLFGGPCCQSFSSIGRGDPRDSRTQLVEHFARLVVELRPRTFVMENVPGLLHRKHRPTLRRLISRIRTAGYSLPGDGALMLDAARFGVPQRRNRVFLIGTLDKEADCVSVPSGVDPSVTVGDAIDDLVDADVFVELLDSDQVRLPSAVLRNMEASVSEYVRNLRSLRTSTFGRPRLWDRTLLTSSMRTKHSERVIRRFRELDPGETDTVSRMPRLSGTSLAPTLRAGTGPDHGSFTSCRPIHHKYDRVITVREAARLHGFPDWFRFHRTKWHGFRQVGNSVPPPLAEAVANEVIRALGCEPELVVLSASLGDPRLLRMSISKAAMYLARDPQVTSGGTPYDNDRRLLHV